MSSIAVRASPTGRAKAPLARDAFAPAAASAAAEAVRRDLRPCGPLAEEEALAEAAADALLQRPSLRPVPSGPPPGATASDPLHGMALQGRTGEPLEAAVREPMERHFGYSLAHVRVHSDDAAEASAHRLGAEAYTLGPHIVFGHERYAPRSAAGRHLLAHELAHVVQQGSGAPRLRLRPDPKAFSALRDPIAASALPDYGFYALGPEFTAPPGLADVQRVLAEVGVVDAATLSACTVSEHTVLRGDLHYFSFRHPTLGVLARAGATLSGYGKGGKAEPRYTVNAYVDADSAAKYRPVGGTGELRSPVGLLGEMSDQPVLSYGELQARLQLLEGRLAAMSARYARSVPALAKALDSASRQAVDAKTRLIASPEISGTIQTALQLAEWVDQDLSLLDRYAAQLAAKKTPAGRVEGMRNQYAGVLDKLFDPSAPGLYDAVQKQIESLPTHIAIDALAKAGRFYLEDGDLLPDAEVIRQWSHDLHGRVDRLYANRDQGQNIEAESEFLSLSMRGLQFYAQRLAVWVDFFNNRPGITDTPLVDAMNRLADRVHDIKDAYDAHDARLLKQRVEAMENDPAINDFYAALPAAMRVTQMIARIGITTLAAMATGGVGGLLSGGARAAATGITVRAAARFVGTAALEAATFTTVNTAASAVVFGDKVSLGNVLRDFAWNLGLFGVLRGVSGLSAVALRAVELQALSMPVNLAAGFPFSHAWGLLRFRLAQHRWPTKDELDRMTAESLLMMGAIVVGTSGVQRWMGARARAGSLKTIHAEYLWRFDALETVRTELGQRIETADAAGKGSDPAALADAKARAETLETAFRDVFEAMLRDKRLAVEEMRKELNALRAQAPDVAAQLMSDVLGVPADALVRRAGPASYTYAEGRTGAIEDALASRYTVTKTGDAQSGLKTLTAVAQDRPTLVFQERSAALDVDTGLFDVNKLVADLKISSPGAYRMLWRILQEQGMRLDPGRATANARQVIKGLVGRAGKGAEADAVLAELHRKGRLGAAAKPEVTDLASALQAKGILRSPEWLEARGISNQLGVVGEWLARDKVAASSGERVLRRVTVFGDLFEDAAGTRPSVNDKGAARVGTTVAETDLVYVSDNAGALDVHAVVNVKASGAKGMAASARQQNANFEAVLHAEPADLVKIGAGAQLRYARVTRITALDGATQLEVTSRLRPASGMRIESVGTKGAVGFTRTLDQAQPLVKAVAELLAERQLIESGIY